MKSLIYLLTSAVKYACRFYLITQTWRLIKTYLGVTCNRNKMDINTALIVCAKKVTFF